MLLGKTAHKGHDTFLALRRPWHGIEIGEAVPESVGFEGAKVRHGAGRLGRIEKASRAFADWLHHAAISEDDKKST
jgi:hypothetical protein